MPVGRTNCSAKKEKGIPHVYKEHPEGHPIGFGKQHILEFFEASRDLRRDPFFPHVVLASPVGWVTADCHPMRHNRWITLDATREGELQYDTVRGNGKGGSVDCPMDVLAADGTSCDDGDMCTTDDSCDAGSCAGDAGGCGQGGSGGGGGQGQGGAAGAGGDGPSNTEGIVGLGGACQCRTTGGRHNTNPAWLALLGLGLVVARRRRRHAA